MEISLKSIKRYIRLSIKSAQNVTNKYYQDKFDPLFGWRIGILNKDEILNEISILNSGAGIHTKDNYSVNQISLLFNIYMEYTKNTDEIDWKRIREEYELKQKSEYEATKGTIDFNPDISYKKDNRGNISLENSDEEENLEIQNENFDLIKSDIDKVLIELNFRGVSRIDIRNDIDNDNIIILTYINIDLSLKELQEFLYKMEIILNLHTDNINNIEIKEQNGFYYIQTLFTLD